MRDIGVFCVGVAALVFTSYYIWAQTHSPEREMQAAFMKSMAEASKYSTGTTDVVPGVIPPPPTDLK